MSGVKRAWRAKWGHWGQGVSWGDGFAFDVTIGSAPEMGRQVIVELDRAKALALRDQLIEWAEQG